MGEYVAAGIQGMGVGMSASGAYNQAQTQKATLGYEAAVADNNAKIADYQARTEQQIGVQQEQAQQLKTANLFGAQRAAMAANGIDLGQGSATDILTGTQFMGERDALTIRDNAARRAWGYNVSAQNYRGEAATERTMGGAIGPGMAAATSLLTGAAGLAGNRKKYGDLTKSTPGANSASDPGKNGITLQLDTSFPGLN